LRCIIHSLSALSGLTTLTVRRAQSLLATLLLLPCGCADTPERAVREIVSAVERGDHDAVAARLTERSRSLYLAAMSVAHEGPAFAPPQEQPEVTVVSKRTEGQALLVVLKEGERARSLSMILEDGRWRVDLMRTGRLSDPMGFGLPSLPGD
jgi:hypothetical protein